METPDTIKNLANDPRIYDMIEKVGEKFSLHIDQMGELDAEVRRVMLGLSQAADFTKNITELLEIDGDKARQITEEVNVQIFQTLKESLKESFATSQPADNTALEKVGGFEIEHDTVEKPDGTINKQEIMDQIEQDTPVVDHLLGNATSSPAEKVETKGEPPPNLPAVEEKPQTAEPKNSGPDPYRETMI